MPQGEQTPRHNHLRGDPNQSGHNKYLPIDLIYKFLKVYSSFCDTYQESKGNIKMEPLVEAYLPSVITIAEYV